MLKINFNTPFPLSQRDIFLHSMRDLGFSYDRIIQNGEYSLFKFFGKLPETNKKTNIDVIIGDDVNIETFNQLLVKDVEIFVMFERS